MVLDRWVRRVPEGLRFVFTLLVRVPRIVGGSRQLKNGASAFPTTIDRYAA
jgi:hypothetical protein